MGFNPADHREGHLAPPAFEEYAARDATLRVTSL